MLPLLDGINKPLSGINFLLNKKYRLLLLPVFFCTTVIFFQHIPIAFTNTQLRCIFRIKSELQFSRIIKNKKVWNNVAFCFMRPTYVATGFRVKFSNLVHYFLQILVVKI